MKGLSHGKVSSFALVRVSEGILSAAAASSSSLPTVGVAGDGSGDEDGADEDDGADEEGQSDPTTAMALGDLKTVCNLYRDCTPPRHPGVPLLHSPFSHDLRWSPDQSLGTN